eukprot:scaffold160296_cov41-Attheya_sp.AAC.2
MATLGSGTVSFEVAGTATTLRGETVASGEKTGTLGLGTVFTLGGATVSAGRGHGVSLRRSWGILLTVGFESVGS